MALITAYWPLDVIIVFTSLLVAAYMYVTRKFNYWKKRGVFEITPTPFLGNFGDNFLLRISSAEFVKSLYDQTKGLPYAGFYIFDKPYLLVRDPELVKNVLVKDFNVFSNRYATPDAKHDRLGYSNVFMMKNPAWKFLRGKLSPFFTSGKLKKMFDLMLVIVDDLEKHLESLHLEGNGKILEFKDLAANVTTDMIGSTAFGLRVNSLADPNNAFRAAGRKIFDYNLSRAFNFITIFFFPHWVDYIHPTVFGKETTDFLRRTFWDVINHRSQTGDKRNDLIDMLIELKEKHKGEDIDGFKFEGDDLLAQAAVFYSAGFETSSTTTAFTLYELALNPEIQKTLRKEIHEALEKTEGKITYEMVTTLPYLDMVVSETLRKYPPLGFLDRVAGADYKVPNSDLVIEKGTPIYISMVGMHYDPEYFPEPEKYDPLRFSDEAKKSRPPFTYFPFGEGPHICIGMRLGLIQTKLAVIQFLKDHEFSVCEKTPIPMVLDPKGLTTTSKGGMYLNVRKTTTAGG
ncbi:cytochrome P450 6k1 [Ceratina calcarata]|uniref:Cytochrome P450 6k1 n=1 Tax=Ceratina calcarata TaxID=156304 RepID=A0AAJ7J1S2_9HYME|nr:cytochrome P450 6k1 [Ceratina calcarata]